MSSERKRLQYVDAVKGIAILCVVFYHLLAPCGFKTAISYLLDLFMAAFFFYSGYFYRPGKRSIAENLRNRAKSLLVPFFRYSLCFWAIGTVYLVATKNETLKEGFLCLRNFFAGCIWNRVIQNWFGWEYYSLGRRYFFLADFWFLIAMFFASIIFFLIADKALRSLSSTLLAALGLFAVTGICMQFSCPLPYNIHLAPFWAALMLLGAYAGSGKLIELPSLSNGTKYAVAIVLLVVGTVIEMVKKPSANLFRGSFGENELISMLVLIAAALPFVSGIGILCSQMEASGIRIKELAWLGSHSLVIYLFHIFYAWILSVITGFSIRYEETASASVLAGSILMTVSSLALCILHSIIADKLKKQKS